MDYLTNDIFNTIQTDEDADAHNVSSPEQSSKKAKGKTGRWRSLSAFSASTTVQDKLLEKSVPHHQEPPVMAPLPPPTPNIHI